MTEQTTIEFMEMTDSEVAVWRMISRRVGKENAVTRDHLNAWAGIPDRKVRDIVHSLIVHHGKMIASDYGGRGGYYVPANQDEINEAFNLLRSHALSILERAYKIKKFDLTKIQRELDFK